MQRYTFALAGISHKYWDKQEEAKNVVDIIPWNLTFIVKNFNKIGRHCKSVCEGGCGRRDGGRVGDHQPDETST